jgi:hypothetical protein
VVCVVGVVCVTFLTILLYGRFNRPGPEPARCCAGCGSGGGEKTPATMPVNPTDLVAKPLAGSGLEMLRIGADDIVAPPDAVMCHAMRRTMADGSADIVTYTVKAKIADVEKFYSDRLTKNGYKFLQRKPAMQPGAVSMMFLRDSQRYSVTLRYTDKEKETVRIVLVMARNDR